jgi:glyoxalase family protein
VKDRYYFQSIYFREPSGILLEIATAGPGFTRDEDPAHLGESLQLPPWFEGIRTSIESRLIPFDRALADPVSSTHRVPTTHGD